MPKTAKKVDERKTEINRLRNDNLSQATQNYTLRLQMAQLRNESESFRASKAEEATKSAKVNNMATELSAAKDENRDLLAKLHGKHMLKS